MQKYLVSVDCPPNAWGTVLEPQNPDHCGFNVSNSDSQFAGEIVSPPGSAERIDATLTARRVGHATYFVTVAKLGEGGWKRRGRFKLDHGDVVRIRTSRLAKV